MKALLGSLIVFCLYATASAAATPADVNGTWLSGDGDGLIAISAVGTGLQGRILGSANRDPDRASTDRKNPDPALRSRPLVGLDIFSGFRYDGNGVWSGGFIYDPNSGKTYRCKVTLVNTDTLKVRGFIGVAVFGRTETWKRRKD